MSFAVRWAWFQVFDIVFNSSDLQVTMTVLYQCSQRCSWCVRREDCNCQAPQALLVRRRPEPAGHHSQLLRLLYISMLSLVLFIPVVELKSWPVSLFQSKGAFLDIVAKCEISRVLLLMLLEVSFVKKNCYCYVKILLKCFCAKHWSLLKVFTYLQVFHNT